LEPGLAVLLRRLSRGVQDVFGNSRGSFFLYRQGKSIRGVEDVFRKLRAELRELFLDRGEARFPLRGELGAAQAEVAHRVLDDLSSRLAQGREIPGSLQRLVLREQRLVLAELGPVLRDLRQVGVVRL